MLFTEIERLRALIKAASEKGRAMLELAPARLSPQELAKLNELLRGPTPPRLRRPALYEFRLEISSYPDTCERVAHIVLAKDVAREGDSPSKVERRAIAAAKKAWREHYREQGGKGKVVVEIVSTHYGYSP
jgi:hypothetical protein